jgi:hypothetical protein
MKGLFALVGYRAVIVEYRRAPRSAGRSKFSGWRRWNFALEGITSFSTLPQRAWTYVGLAIAKHRAARGRSMRRNDESVDASPDVEWCGARRLMPA